MKLVPLSLSEARGNKSCESTVNNAEPLHNSRRRRWDDSTWRETVKKGFGNSSHEAESGHHYAARDIQRGSVRVPVAVVRVPVSVEVLVVRVLDPLSNQQQVGWQPTG